MAETQVVTGCDIYLHEFAVNKLCKKIKGALYCIIKTIKPKNTPRDSIPISYLAKN